jgi:hypothetical protein
VLDDVCQFSSHFKRILSAVSQEQNEHFFEAVLNARPNVTILDEFQQKPHSCLVQLLLSQKFKEEWQHAVQITLKRKLSPWIYVVPDGSTHQSEVLPLFDRK